jgi:hypothetical protein
MNVYSSDILLFDNYIIIYSKCETIITDILNIATSESQTMEGRY